MKVREDRLNEHFSQSEFKLDQGEALLKEMQQLRDELSQYEDEVSDRKIHISSDKCQASRLLKVVCPTLVHRAGSKTEYGTKD